MPVITRSSSNGGRLVRMAAVAFGGLLLAAPQAQAGHNIFHIFTPAVEAGAWGAEALSAVQFGFPAAAHEDEDEHDDAAADHEAHGHGDVRAAHEFAIHGGVTDYWMAKLALSAERAPGDGYDLTSFASENVFRLFAPRGGMVDAAWFAAVSVGIDSEATNAFEFGPVLSFANGPLAITLNPFFEKTFGRNREDGMAFTYAWRATYELADQLSIGVEGYGEIENIAHAPAARDQVHRIGPVLYLGHVHGNPTGIHGEKHHEHGHGHEHENHAGTPEWHGEVGVLFGLTEATPDAALKINIGADF